MINDLTSMSHAKLYIKSNLDILEELLNQKTQEYLKIQKEEKNYNLGPQLTKKSLRNIIREIEPEVDNFLGIKTKEKYDVRMYDLSKTIQIGALFAAGTYVITSLMGLGAEPILILNGSEILSITIGMTAIKEIKQNYDTSSYSRINNVIRIKQQREAGVIGSFAHEYTHHLQYSTKIPMTRESPLAEGHARGVEGIISKLFTEKYDNPAFLIGHTKRTAKEFKEAYIYCCEEKKIQPKKSLVETKVPFESLRTNKLLKAIHYPIGVSELSIAEAKHGKKIYQDLIKNDFSFLEL